MTQTMALSTETVAILNQRGLPVMALIAVNFAVCITKWATRRRTRQTLRQLDDWQLRDVGLTQVQADTEASRVFWQP